MNVRVVSDTRAENSPPDGLRGAGSVSTVRVPDRTLYEMHAPKQDVAQTPALTTAAGSRPVSCERESTGMPEVRRIGKRPSCLGTSHESAGVADIGLSRPRRLAYTRDGIAYYWGAA
jgi:hypothetical protein